MFVTNPGNTRFKSYAVIVPYTNVPSTIALVPGRAGKRAVIYAGYLQTTGPSTTIEFQATSGPDSTLPTVSMAAGTSQGDTTNQASQSVPVVSPLIGYVDGNFQAVLGGDDGSGVLIGTIVVGYIDPAEGVDPSEAITP